MAKRKTSPPAGTSSPSVRDTFRREIEQLLREVPAEQWDDPDVRGVLYEFVPWDRMSSVTVQTRDDDPRDIGAWKYYFSAESDGSLLREQYAAWHDEGDKRRVYHRLLVEAAEALLSIEFGKFINPKLPTPLLNLRDWTVIDGDFCLNKIFFLQVYDPDQSFRFNYCEYAMARRLEPAEPGATP